MRQVCHIYAAVKLKYERLVSDAAFNLHLNFFTLKNLIRCGSNTAYELGLRYGEHIKKKTASPRKYDVSFACSSWIIAIDFEKIALENKEQRKDFHMHCTSI